MDQSRMSNSTRCAACRSLRRRCSQDCVLAPYFPANNPQRFASVHKIFGASNVTKILERVPIDLRADAADCMSFEASSRIRDPVYGCSQMISQLQQQINQTQLEIAKVRGQITFYDAQQQQQLHLDWQNQLNSVPTPSEQHGFCLAGENSYPYPNPKF